MPDLQECIRRYEAAQAAKRAAPTAVPPVATCNVPAPVPRSAPKVAIRTISVVDAQRLFEAPSRQYVAHRRLTGDVVADGWAEFCRTIEDRIKAMRADAADLRCPTCGSTTPEHAERRWCSGCQMDLPRANFSKAGDGLRRICRSCDAARNKAYRTRIALNGGRNTSGRVVAISGRTRRAS